MIIDAGQRRIGVEQCKECGMVFNVDEPKDLDMHKAFHNRHSGTRDFRVTTNQLEAWKRVLVFEEVDAPLKKGWLFRLTKASPSTLLKRTEEIIEGYVNEELGYCADLPVWDGEGLRQALVFVAAASAGEPALLGGVVLIDRVPQVTLMPEGKRFHDNFLGVNRIWVHSAVRRKGIASLLLDSARRMLVSGGVLPKSRVAFSEPTEQGQRLASAYLNDKENRHYITYSMDAIPQKQMKEEKADGPMAKWLKIEVEAEKS